MRGANGTSVLCGPPIFISSCLNEIRFIGHLRHRPCRYFINSPNHPRVQGWSFFYQKSRLPNHKLWAENDDARDLRDDVTARLRWKVPQEISDAKIRRINLFKVSSYLWACVSCVRCSSLCQSRLVIRSRINSLTLLSACFHTLQYLPPNCSEKFHGWKVVLASD